MRGAARRAAVSLVALAAGLAWLVLAFYSEERPARALPGSTVATVVPASRGTTGAPAPAERSDGVAHSLDDASTDAAREERGASAARVADGARVADDDLADVRGRIEDLLASADARARFEGLRALAQLAPQEAVPSILEYIETTRDDERALLQRVAAVALLGEIAALDDVSTATELVKLYDRDDSAVRRAAALALAQQGDETLIVRELFALRTGLGDPDGGVRAQAAESAAALASPTVIPVILPLLNDPNSDVRAQAVDGLWLAGDPLYLPELERMLEDPVELVRERAQRAIDVLRLPRDAGARAAGR